MNMSEPDEKGAPKPRYSIGFENDVDRVASSNELLRGRDARTLGYWEPKIPLRWASAAVIEH